MKRMRWLMGIDLGARSRGILELAAWLREHSGGSTLDEFVAVHVLDERARRLLERARPLVGPDRQSDLIPTAERALQEFVDELAVAPLVTDSRVVTGASPEQGIIDALAADAFDGLILGGAADHRGRRLPSLGRVARRLLRRLPSPVVLVPAHFAASGLGSGPLLLASDLSTPSAHAAAFARRLGAAIGRAVVVVHVDPGPRVLPSFWGEPFVVPGLPHRVPADVDVWAASVELDPLRTRLAEGDVVENVLDAALRESSPLVICGSRRLDAVERIFSTSTSNELARLMPCPVIVVPSH